MINLVFCLIQHSHAIAVNIYLSQFFMHHHHSHDCVHSYHFDSEGTHRLEKVRLLWTVLVLVSCFSLSELAVSFWSHSLALQAESGHMIGDSLALGLSLIAAWSADRFDKLSFGVVRFEVLAALINGIGLVAIALWVGWEAIARLQSPPVDILSLPMLVTAVLGLGVNSINAFLLHDRTQDDLNMRGAFLHIMADLISSVGVILAAIAVWLMHWFWADGLISLFVSTLIFLSAIPLITQTLTEIRNS